MTSFQTYANTKGMKIADAGDNFMINKCIRFIFNIICIILFGFFGFIVFFMFILGNDSGQLGAFFITSLVCFPLLNCTMNGILKCMDNIIKLFNIDDNPYIIPIYNPRTR